MLIISLKRHQAITIGDATIVVTKVTGTRAVLGIEAPRELQVIRVSEETDESCKDPRTPHPEQSQDSVSSS